MSHTLEAIFENGVLRPLGKLELGERQRVFITVDSSATTVAQPEPTCDDPMDGIRAATGIPDLAEHFSDLIR